MRDIVIIGGGVAGMAIAWEAQKNGHSVLLLEKDACGGGASQASAGILSPAGKSCGDPELNRFIWQGIRMFPDWIKELRPACEGITAEIVANLLENAFRYSPLFHQ